MKKSKKEIKIIEIKDNKLIINKETLRKEQILKDLYIFNLQ